MIKTNAHRVTLPFFCVGTPWYHSKLLRQLLGLEGR